MLFAPTLADKAILPTAWGGSYFFNRIDPKRSSGRNHLGSLQASDFEYVRLNHLLWHDAPPCNLHKFVSDEAGFERGVLTCIATHAYLDVESLGGAKAAKQLLSSFPDSE
ncbi:hypothetical protein CXB65_21560 [Pseudomonas monteilii]|uniref:Uncharacterized protein n=1 Tax=Pseudomonas monteilii TaxID=76759 RepID=A0A2N1IN11_9PSED|nr:hypothetical protein CXB65_21560 [Pseudomonas monteilii]RPD93840.1 hypothetical protein EGN69_13285 [Pseudomonas monteilii]